MIQRCIRCGGGARNPVCAKCRRIVGDVHSPSELALVESENQIIEEAASRRYSFEGICSFFIPGLGQLLKGHFLKAIGIWLGYAFCILIILWGGLALMLILWLSQLDDAFRCPDSGTRAALQKIADRRGWRR